MPSNQPSGVTETASGDPALPDNANGPTDSQDKQSAVELQPQNAESASSKAEQEDPGTEKSDNAGMNN